MYMNFNGNKIKLALMSGLLVAGLGLSACANAQDTDTNSKDGGQGTEQSAETSSAKDKASESSNKTNSGDIKTSTEVPSELSLSEAELDTKIASYTYKGESKDITARMAIENATSLEASKLEDGRYPYPTAELLVAYVRTQVMNSLVAENNITIDDAAIDEFIEHNFGKMSLADVAKQFNISEDKAKQILTDSAGAFELSKKITGEMPKEPEAPQAPEPGKENESTEAYAEYVKSLVGDAWDSSKSAWNENSKDYYEALKDYSFDGKTADYSLAQAAYYVAYSDWTNKSKANSQNWLNYMNAEYAKASLTIDKVIQ